MGLSIGDKSIMAPAISDNRLEVIILNAPTISFPAYYTCFNLALQHKIILAVSTFHDFRFPTCLDQTLKLVLQLVKACCNNKISKMFLFK